MHHGLASICPVRDKDAAQWTQAPSWRRRWNPQLPFRTILFAPGDSPRKVAKAVAGEADCVVLDLEDSVAPSAKADARREAVELLRGGRGRSVGVRVNDQSTGWYLDDLVALVPARPDFIMLPKCNRRADLVMLHHHLCALEAASPSAPSRIGTVPLVTESAAALRELDYENVGDRLMALCFAGEDLAADLGVSARDESGRLASVLSHARTAVLIAAKVAGVPAIDTPFPDPRDQDGLVREASAAARDGFAGKLCIHPDQLAVVAAAFRPNASNLEWAEAVFAAFAAAPGAGVAVLDGKMIDKAHLRLAEQIRGNAVARETA